MSDSPAPVTPGHSTPPTEATTEALQFDHAETDQSAGGAACALCRQTLTAEYHDLNGFPICSICRAREEERLAADRSPSRFLVAAIYGCGAAVAGSIVYWGFTKLTGFEFGLMAIAVGWAVGKSVMKGSNHRGGRKFQILALILTYFSITFSYVPFMFEGAAKQQAELEAKSPKPAPRPSSEPAASVKTPKAGDVAFAFGVLFLVILAAPFLAGVSNIIGWVIIAIGLFEAWKFTRGQPFVLSGPYSLAERARE